MQVFGAAILLGLVLTLTSMSGLMRAILFKGVELDRIQRTNIYVSPKISEKQRKKLIEIYLRASARVQNLWGKTTASPTLLVGNEMGFLERYGDGNTHAGMTYFTPLGSYIILDSLGTNIDVMAHELCHAELSKRVGWKLRQREIPTWFDEGLAMLVDERFPDWYDELFLMTQGGRNVPKLDDLKTPKQFFAERSLLNYFVAKKIVKDWYTLEKSQGLIEFSEDVATGTTFDERFWGKRP